MSKPNTKHFRNTPEYREKEAWAKAFILSSIEKKIQQEGIIKRGKGVLRQHFDGVDFETEEIWDAVFEEMDIEDILKMSEKELKQLVFNYYKTEKDSWLIHDDTPIKVEHNYDVQSVQSIEPEIASETLPVPHFASHTNNRYSSLVNLFFDETVMIDCIRALSLTKPRIVDDNMNYALSPRKKSAVAVWIKVLKDKHKIKDVDDSKLAFLLNGAINNLNMGLDGKTFRAISQTAINKFEKQLIDLIV